MTKDIILIILIVGLVAGGIAGFYFMDADGFDYTTNHGYEHDDGYFLSLHDPLKFQDANRTSWKLWISKCASCEKRDIEQITPIYQVPYWIFNYTTVPHETTEKIYFERLIENGFYIEQFSRDPAVYFSWNMHNEQQEYIDHLESELAKQIQRQIEFEKDLTELRQEINDLKNQ